MTGAPLGGDIASRDSALAEAGQAAVLLYGAGADQVWICGSLAHGRHWDAASDLDLVTTGLSPALRPQLTRQVSERCSRRVDLIMLEDAPPALRALIVPVMAPVDRSGLSTLPRTLPAAVAAPPAGTAQPITQPMTLLTGAGPAGGYPLPIGLHRQRHAAAARVVLRAGSRRVLDLGCGQGGFISALIRASDDLDTSLGSPRPPCRVTGLDPDSAALEDARAHLSQTLTASPDLVRLVRGGVADLDRHGVDHDALVALEVIEHLDPPVLDLLGEITFGRLRPALVVLSTPNAQFNAVFGGRRAMRHRDHRFEWDREQLAAWAGRVSDGYRFTIDPVGEPHPDHGSPSQLLTFVRAVP